MQQLTTLTWRTWQILEIKIVSIYSKERGKNWDITGTLNKPNILQMAGIRMCYDNVLVDVDNVYNRLVEELFLTNRSVESILL